MDPAVKQTPEHRRDTIFAAIVEAFRKAGATESKACCVAKYLMEDKRLQITVKRQTQPRGKETIR